MTLRRKMSLLIAAMVVGLLLVGGAGLAGLNALHHDYGVALEGYQRLRQVYEASSHLATAQTMLRMPHRETLRAAREEIRLAGRSLDQLPPPGDGWDAEADAAVRSAMADLVRSVEDRAADATGADDDLPRAAAEERRAQVNAVLARIPQLAAGIRRTTEARQAAAQAKRRATLWTVGLLSGAAVAGGLLLGVAQHRSVMRPLNRLAAGVRRVAAGQFNDRLDARGGDEFAALARDFNRMAEELDGFYHALEQKVAAKSKELVRSERLASVGYLAAGVAHEINNPLAIIAGYAEYSMADLRRRSANGATAAVAAGSAAELSSPTGSSSADANRDTHDPDGGPDADVVKSLEVIRDEAFRCKAITGKLLSLARPGDDNRKPVSLAAVADHVGSVVGGLAPFRDRRLVVRADRRDELVVHAVEAEVRQVLLNLTVNALEAVAPGTGEVRIEARRDGAWVELAVADNGRGMTPETLERAFEPFYTEKRGTRDDGAQSTGTGLGLAITHAIVESHGGRVTAHSDGPGRGSRFVVRLPAVVGKVEDGG